MVFAMSDNLPCICGGNWRKIVNEAEALLDKTFCCDGRKYIFYGVVHGSDDYYYGMVDCENGKCRLLSCVGSIEQHGFSLI